MCFIDSIFRRIVTAVAVAVNRALAKPKKRNHTYKILRLRESCNFLFFFIVFTRIFSVVINVEIDVGVLLNVRNYH